MTVLIKNSVVIAADPNNYEGRGCMDPHQELRDAINLLADITEAFTAALFLRREKDGPLRPFIWHTLSRSFRADADIAPGEGLVGFVAKHGTPVDVDRYKQGSNATLLYEHDEGVKAFVGMPVGQDGVLVVDTKNRLAFGEREKKIIRDFSKVLANLVEHTKVFAREELYGRMIDLLFDVENASLDYRYAGQFYSEILEAGLKFTGFSMGVICLLLPGRKQYTLTAAQGASMAALKGRSFPVSQGLLGWILREARPLAHSRLRPLKGKSYLISPDEPMAGYNAFVGAPLLAWRRLTGVWAFAGSLNRDLAEDEMWALQLAGHRVAATIDHYRLS
jgi:signal transduction protein with GAF and PtsI domain